MPITTVSFITLIDPRSQRSQRARQSAIADVRGPLRICHDRRAVTLDQDTRPQRRARNRQNRCGTYAVTKRVAVSAARLLLMTARAARARRARMRAMLQRVRAARRTMTTCVYTVCCRGMRMRVRVREHRYVTVRARKHHERRPATRRAACLIHARCAYVFTAHAQAHAQRAFDSDTLKMPIC